MYKVYDGSTPELLLLVEETQTKLKEAARNKEKIEYCCHVCEKPVDAFNPVCSVDKGGVKYFVCKKGMCKANVRSGKAIKETVYKWYGNSGQTW